MKQDNINYFMVGIFVLSMMLILITTLVFIKGGNSDTKSYFANYSNIAGIRAGTPVSYEGFLIGKVGGIYISQEEGKTNYQLELNVRSDWKIPADSIAKIVTPGVLSDNQVDISEGESTEILNPLSTIIGQENTNLIASVDEVVSEFKDLSKNNIQPIIHQLGVAVTNATNNLNNVGKEINNNIPILFSSTQQLLNQLNYSVDKISSILNTENQDHISAMVKNTHSLSKNLLEVSEGFNHTLKDVDSLLQRSNSALNNTDEELRLTLLDLRKILETVSQSIDSIVHYTETTSRNLSEFSYQIRSNPGVLIRGKAPQDGRVVNR